MVKRKKHDKDKYYNLARQQGYRARSAFKLIQLNKKYDFLSSAKVCIDLCAAPGGWCQVAAKYMPVSSIILGIDLLPIRPIRNVKTFQCDITTQKCRQIIKQELQTWQADVVLCDGAPNVGAEYSKDAYVQNELALIALKLAVDVLGRDGTFVTKVFRSQDYNALLWVFKQLFKKVSATKPLSSRNESAEIFVVCEKYLAPQSIDPKMLDPKHVFGQIDNENKGINIFHPKYGQQRRHREGYNEDLGMTLTNKVSVTDFINSMDPIQLLTDATEIQFITDGDKQIKEYKETNEEILTCLSDLKVLGKSEFKNLLKWRTKMKGYLTKLNKEDESDIKKRNEEIQLASVPETITEEQHEDNINEELAQIRSNVVAKKKREKKKEREKKAKLRLRAAMGMDLNTVELQQDDSIFNLQTLNISKDNVNDLNESTVLPEDCEDDDVLKNESSESSDSDSDDDADTKKMESEMDEMYNAFLNRKGTKDMNRKAVKRSKIAKRALAGEALVEDHAMYDGDMKAYEEMLAVEQSDDSSDEDENRLVVKPKIKEDEPVVVSRWFSSNPLFNDIEEKLMATRTNIEDEKEHSDADTVEMHEDEDGDLIPKMPLTEKEKRKIKRKNLVEKKEKKLAKQQSSNLKLTGERDDYELVGNDEIEEINELKKDDTLETEEQKQKKALIRQGMGNTINESDLNTSKNIEVVPLEKEELPVFDDRKYDSDAEEYDEEDRAKTLALAHLMMRKSKAKELIDASYNRYTWNDSADLPDWFVDDEEKHYRAQIPVSKEVLDEMKTRFLEMATKPLKKVAEARARKKRLQLKKMKTARKKATDIANMPDMSNREKIKAIEGTMKSAKLQKKNKVYVVSRRNGKTSNAKNQKKGSGGGCVKLVDARLRADTRNLKMKKKRGKKK